MKKFITDNKYLSCAAAAIVSDITIGCILWNTESNLQNNNSNICADILGYTIFSMMGMMLTTVQIVFDRYVHPKFSDEPFVQYSLTAAESVLSILAYKQDTDKEILDFSGQEITSDFSNDIKTLDFSNQKKKVIDPHYIALILINTFKALTCKYILELDSTDMESEIVMNTENSLITQENEYLTNEIY
jgi:hypothetical protein